MPKIKPGVVFLIALFATAIAVSCDAGAETPPEETATSTAIPVETGAPGSRTSIPASIANNPELQFASHVFVETGSAVDISDYGEFLGQVDYSAPPAVSVTGNSAQVERSGVSCLRFRYRDTPNEGHVQTQCIVSFDETGSCDGLAPLSLDLEQNAPSDLIPEGSNADLFESGEGTFYAACTTGDGQLRLQQPEQDLPPLFMHIVDAYGEGPYSYGTPEFELYRNAAVQTYSGDLLRPGMAHVMSGEIDALDFGPVGPRGFDFTFNDCAAGPACSDDPDVVMPGDILAITWSGPMDRMAKIAESATTNGFAEWFTATTGVEWQKVEDGPPELKAQVLARLLNIDAMNATIEMFDDLYGIREKQVTVAYTPFWPVMDVSRSCFPAEDGLTPCGEIEEALHILEAAHIESLKEAGFTLWLGGNADYGFDGTPRSWREELRPSMSFFDGYLLRVAANQHQPKETVPEILSEVMAALAAEMRGTKPVHLMVGGPPVTGVTISEFCEAEICTADFGPAYDQAEAWLDAAMRSFKPGQVTGLSVALFDGAHYDILDPYEKIGPLHLNRAAETGYNSPILNIYRSQ